MRLPFPHRLLSAISAALGAGLLTLAANDSPLLDSAWDDAATLRVQEAYGNFSAAEKSKTGDPRDVDFGLAVSLLNLQPRTTGNIDRAEALFTQLIIANPNDEVGIASQYYLARVEQVHRNAPNLPKALHIYDDLIRQHPDHFYAQTAITKVAILKLDALPSTADKSRMLVEVEQLRPLLKDPAARCNFALTLGNACILYHLGDEKAMHYLMEADALGIPVQVVEANVLIRIGNLATRLGRKEIAIAHFEHFLEKFPRNTRSYTVREKIKELKGARP